MSRRSVILLLLASAALLAATDLGAVPARKDPFTATQPDGSRIILRVHGDEFFHWLTDENGNVVEQADDGWYRLVPSSAGIRSRSVQASARRMRAARIRQKIRLSALTEGSRHIPVVLIAFRDVPFRIENPNEAFTALLNQHGYSANGATGSVKDYYEDNSKGRFQPVFDVYGPVTLASNMSTYGRNHNGKQGEDEKPEIALYEALQQLDQDPTVDFSIYDSDGDGNVDMTLFYYAGYNEAEGGPANSIWPHQWSLDESSDMGAARNSFDGVHFANYFCTSELKGSSGSEMCGIGTTCHEFAHSLGLPDFYDTNYATNGEAAALFNFSLMCSGPYNNNSNTPPYMNAEELLMLGWMEEEAMVTIGNEGQYAIPAISEWQAAKIESGTEGEYFVLETRGHQGWDAPLPGGLLIYHVDKSKVRTVGGTTPYELWNNWEASNAINTFASHPCFYIIPAANPASLTYGGSEQEIIFPGIYGKKSYTPVDWNNSKLEFSIQNIAYSGHVSTLFIEKAMGKTLSGFVSDYSGNPLGGVSIHVNPVEETEPSNVRIRSVKPMSATSAYVAQTNSQGRFSIDLNNCSAPEVEVCAYLRGYVAASQDIALEEGGINLSMKLLKAGEPVPADLQKWRAGSIYYPFGYSNTMDDGRKYPIMGAVLFTKDELASHVGEKVRSVSLLTTCLSAESLDIVIDFGNTRTLTYRVPDPVFGDFATIDIEEQDIRIPENTDVYFGYAVGPADGSQMGTFVQNSFKDSYYSQAGDVSSWQQMVSGRYYFDLVLSVTLLKEQDPPGEEPPLDESLSGMGFASIGVPDGFEFIAGAEFPLQIIPAKEKAPDTVEWTLDGEAVSGESITVTPGSHLLRATLRYAGGLWETIDLEFSAE